MSDATSAKAWPFDEARRLLQRLGNKAPEKGYVLFETGYGPSGLPHIGTFGEVVRTMMVKRAFEEISDIPTKLICFSDDLDGFRKVPTNVPNQDMLAEHLDKPLTVVPDPFGTHDSFGRHNNNRLQQFLDQFGFDYEFKSSTDAYKAGEFDDTLLKILQNYDAVINVILPTLGEERRKTYSPFLPISPSTGKVLQVPLIDKDVDAGTITFEDEDGQTVTVPVTGGHCKLQWKVDWAMRWVALDVDYEMSGKDLSESVKLSSQITKVLGSRPPQNLTYELFLDDQGGKISKSKGNGLSLEEWLTYAPAESLALFMYQKPKTAKRMYFDVIPKAVDEYLTFSQKLENDEKPFDNPAWHIETSLPVARKSPVTPLNFSILLNLASVCNTEDKSVLWGFISRYDADLNPDASPLMDELVGYAIAYYRDFVKPHKNYRAATDEERTALEDLLTTLEGLEDGLSASDLQTEIFTIGKKYYDKDLKSWFKTLYQVLLGQDQGPRMGSFIALYGKDETINLIKEKLS